MTQLFDEWTVITAWKYNLYKTQTSVVWAADSLCFGVTAGDLPHLSLAVANQELDTEFGTAFDVRELLTHSPQDDVLRRDTKAPHQLQLLLQSKKHEAWQNERILIVGV